MDESLDDFRDAEKALPAVGSVVEQCVDIRGIFRDVLSEGGCDVVDVGRRRHTLGVELAELLHVTENRSELRHEGVLFLRRQVEAGELGHVAHVFAADSHHRARNTGGEGTQIRSAELNGDPAIQ